MNYASFLTETRYPFCWWCGRQYGESAPGWSGHQIIERAHIVSKPRVLDRRVVVLLCSRCHYAQTNGVSGYELPVCVVGNMLWLKSVFDPNYWDRRFVQLYTVQRLPRLQRPPIEVQQEFSRRMGEYPRWTSSKVAGF